jgi:hypothetical protein
MHSNLEYIILFSLVRMEGFAPDLGKIVLPGFTNANPPGQTEFAFSANGSGFAGEIAQAGGSVVVDNLGGINLVASSGAFVGVDSFANITLNTSTTSGVILLQTNGLGYDVDINNAGTIAFDALGAGAITGVQTINGSVYPPAGGGGTSITQAGALVACLGNGAINISSIGGGVTADIVNAGTITFDTAGPKAITNLSTINGAAYPSPLPANASFSTITLGTGGYLTASDPTGYITASTFEGLGGTDTNITCAPDQTMYFSGGATISDKALITMNTDGSVLMNNTNIGGQTSGSGLNIGAEGQFIEFPLDPTSTYGVGFMTNISTISNLAGGGTLSLDAANLVLGTTAAGITRLNSVSTINTYPSGTKIYNDYGSLSEYYVKVGENGNITAKSGATALAPADGSTSQLDLNNDATLSLLANTVDGPSGLAISNAGYDTVLTGYNTLSLNCIGTTTGLDFNDIGSVDLYANGGDMTVYTNTAAAINISSLGAYNLTSATTTGQISGLSTINGVAYPTAFSGGQFYKTGNQTTPSATSTYCSFTGSVYQTGSAITLDGGGSSFTVNTAGIYQLEWMFAVQPGNSTWTNLQKVSSIDITRESVLYNAILDTRSISSASLWGACVIGSFSLEVGDIISCRVVQPTLAGGSPTVAFLQGQTTSTLDNNTSFTYRKLN